VLLDAHEFLQALEAELAAILAQLADRAEECGARIPETHGFCCLNVTSNSVSCAGLDLQPALLGARGVELLIAALHRNDCGVPEHPSTTTIPAIWVDGPTLQGK
jgi:LacI family transcriptional regulator